VVRRVQAEGELPVQLHQRGYGLHSVMPPDLVGWSEALSVRCTAAVDTLEFSEVVDRSRDGV
jgi:hypothetical protein